MTTVEFSASFLRLVGMILLIPGLWFVAGGLRVVVSGRIDERRTAARSLRIGLPLLVVGALLLVGSAWLANWTIQ